MSNCTVYSRQSPVCTHYLALHAIALLYNNNCTTVLLSLHYCKTIKALLYNPAPTTDHQLYQRGHSQSGPAHSMVRDSHSQETQLECRNNIQLNQDAKLQCHSNSHISIKIHSYHKSATITITIQKQFRNTATVPR